MARQSRAALVERVRQLLINEKPEHYRSRPQRAWVSPVPPNTVPGTLIFEHGSVMVFDYGADWRSKAEWLRNRYRVRHPSRSEYYPTEKTAMRNARASVIRNGS